MGTTFCQHFCGTPLHPLVSVRPSLNGAFYGPLAMHLLGIVITDVAT